MLDKQGKKKLDQWAISRKRNIARLIYIAHRHIHEWALKKWREDGWETLHPDHLRLISIIGVESVNNKELAKRARVTKQAMSKMVNVLEKQGFIDVVPDPADSRAKIISISQSGVEFLSYFGNCGKELEKKFSAIIGEKKSSQLIDIMGELTDGIIECEKQEIIT